MILTPILVVMVGCVTIATVSAYDTAVAESIYGTNDLMERLQAASKRDHECSLIGGKCFNAGQCCAGLLCAMLDKEIGPEVPGDCVRGKDLQPCTSGPASSEDCPTGHQCMSLGRTRQRYCIPVSSESSGFRSIKMTDRRRFHGQSTSKEMGKLGSPCMTDSECYPLSEDGLHRMCCQLVNQGRQGTKRICDRVTQISTCLSV